MTRKKVVLVIVEGPSDETALGIALSQVFDKDKVHVHIMYGDITTRIGVTSQNILSKIGDEVKAYALKYKLKAKDFKQLIHIVDMDAVYLSDDCIHKDSQCKDLSYQNDGIYTDDVDKVVSRNKQKRDNLYRLRGCGRIWQIPYRVYYMSCNLDHVLYDSRNSSDDEKEKNAYRFAKTYNKNSEAFVDFMCNSSFSVSGSFNDSWDFIEKDMHSIERYSNFNICLEEEGEN